MGIIEEGSNLNEFATPDVVVVEVQPPSIIGERSTRIPLLIGDFTWGPENEVTTISGDVNARRTFGSYKEGLKGYLDLYTMLRQGINGVKVVRATPPDGTPVKSNITITQQHYVQTDAGSIVKFYSAEPTPLTNDPISITIADGSVPGTNVTVTIDDGVNPAEVFTDVDMDETIPASFLVDVINSGSDLVRVERLSLNTVDTLPTLQVATDMTSTENIDTVQFEAKTAGINGNNIKVTISDGSGYTKNVTIIDLTTETSESFYNLNMIVGDGNYIVDVITAGSTLVDVTRVDTNSANLIPKNQNTPYITLEGGSDGGLEYATLTAQDGALNDIVTFKSKYRGSYSNNIAIKIYNKTSYINVEIADQEGNIERYNRLDMNPTSSKYLVDVINDASTGSSVVTAERNSLETNFTLPTTISTFTSLSGGSDGDPIDDTSIQDAIDIVELDDEVDVITIGSQSNGTLYANAIALRDMCERKRERIAIINSDSGADEDAAIVLAEAVSSEFVVVTHPEQYVKNPITRQKEVIAYSPSYAAVLSTLGFHRSPSRSKIKYTLGNTRKISMTGSTITTNDLTVGGVSPIGYIRGIGSYAIINGINTSTDETVEQISTVAMRSFIAKQLVDGLQQYVSLPHTPNLRIKVRTTIKDFLLRLLNDETIGDPDELSPEKSFKVICDESNNPRAVVVAKMLHCDVLIKLLAPADLIVIKLTANENVIFDFA